MNLEQLREKLVDFARQCPSSERVPYAFEKRIMVRLRKTAAMVADPWTVWNRVLWRAAVPSLGIMLLVSMMALISSSSMSRSESLALELEETVLAPLASLEDTW